MENPSLAPKLYEINCPKWLCFLPTPQLCKACRQSIIFPVSLPEDSLYSRFKSSRKRYGILILIPAAVFNFTKTTAAVPEELAGKQPFPFALKKPREPLSFGMILLAVVLGIIIVSFL